MCKGAEPLSKSERPKEKLETWADDGNDRVFIKKLTFKQQSCKKKLYRVSHQILKVGGIRVPKSKDLVILEKVGFEGSKVGYWKWLHE